MKASHTGTHTASTSTWSPRSPEATGSATYTCSSPARLGSARHGLRAHSYCMRVGGDSQHFMRAPRAYRKRCESVPAATAASAGDFRALLPEFDTSLCRYLLSPRSRVQFGATRRGSSVSAGGWHRRARCSVRRCSLAVSGHGSGAAKPAKTARRSPSTLVERPICRNHSRGGHLRKISLYPQTRDFRHRKTERRLIACRQTLGAFMSSNRRGRHARSGS